MLKTVAIVAGLVAITFALPGVGPALAGALLGPGATAASAAALAGTIATVASPIAVVCLLGTVLKERSP